MQKNCAITDLNGSRDIASQNQEFEQNERRIL